MTNVETRNAQLAKSRDHAIDYQSAMYQGVQSLDRLVTLNNLQVLAKAAKLFGSQDYHDGSAERALRTIHAGDTSLFPEYTVIGRTSMNSCLTPRGFTASCKSEASEAAKADLTSFTIINLARRAESGRLRVRGATRTSTQVADLPPRNSAVASRREPAVLVALTSREP